MRGYGEFKDKDLGELKQIDKAGADLLRQAIVESAIQEYVIAYTSMKKYEARGKHEIAFKHRCVVESVEHFFNSQWFTFLCDLDAKQLIDLLQNKAIKRCIRKEEIANRRKDKNGKKGKDNIC